jgi:hypothetical protein
MTDSSLKNLNLFRDLCGNKAMRNVILVTTMWDQVKSEVGKRREELLKQQWLPMLDLGSKVAHFEGTFDSAWRIIDRIMLELPADAIRLQEEMVDLQLPLGRTKAGIALYEMRQNYLAKQREAILRLLREAEAEDNEKLVQELTAEYKIIQGDFLRGFGDPIVTKGDILSRIRLLFSSRKALSVSLVILVDD